MQIPPRLCNRAIVRIRSAGSRLVARFHGDGTIESTVRVTSIGLWLSSNTNTVPTCEELVYVSSGSAP